MVSPCLYVFASVTSVLELHAIDAQVSWSAVDGQRVDAGTRFGTVRGPAASILVAERIALNFVQRMSGIATATAALVAAAAGTRARILDTRKTVPGLRLLDKWAVAIGEWSPSSLVDSQYVSDYI
jgi:nicotinate-nucleotide pyrophosphorylase (carboxylating)